MDLKQNILHSEQKKDVAILERVTLLKKVFRFVSNLCVYLFVACCGKFMVVNSESESFGGEKVEVFY